MCDDVIYGCRMVELPSVEIKEKDICVKMLAAPINPSDINRIQGCLLSHFTLLSVFLFDHGFCFLLN